MWVLWLPPHGRQQGWGRGDDLQHLYPSCKLLSQSLQLSREVEMLKLLTFFPLHMILLCRLFNPSLLCRDKSIPAVESVAGDERSVQELEHLSRLMEQQAHLEDQVRSLGIVVRTPILNVSVLQVIAHCQEDTGFHLESECHAPEPCQEFQTARLILSHLGLLTMSSLRVSEGKKTSMPAGNSISNVCAFFRGPLILQFRG